MSDLKISQLTDGGASQATDEYVVARSGSNYRIDGASVAAAATSVGTLSSLTVSGDLTVDTSTLKVDSTNNRVGIGTASPDRILTVAGTNALMNLKAANTGYSEFYFSDAAGDPGYLSYDHNTDSLLVGVNGSARLSISSAGNLAVDTNTLYVDAANNNVGIGTASPSSPLAVVGGGTQLSWSADVGISYTRNGTAGSSASMALSAGNTGAAFIYFGNASTQQNGALYYDNNSNAMVFQTNGGNERLRIDASGNLGLGVTPSAWGTYTALQISANSSIASFTNGETRYSSNAYYTGSVWKYITSSQYASAYTQGAGAHTWYTAASGTAGNTITFTQAMTLDASGNLFIGATGTSAKLNVKWASSATDFFATSGTVELSNTNSTNNAGTWFVNRDSAGNGNAYIGFRNIDQNYAGAIVFGTSNSGATNYGERARITSGGYFKASNDGTYNSSTGVYHELRQNSSTDWIWIATHTHATQPAGFQIYYSAASPNGTGNQFLNFSDSTAARAVIRSNGGLANYQANNADLSDARTKTDITPLDSMWGKVAALEIVSYKYIDQTHDDVNLGVIAQQVETVEPVWVDSDGFGEAPEGEEPLKMVYNKDITFAAIKALQEAMARIEALEVEVAALKGGA